MLRGLLLGAGVTVFAALPGTNNYQLRDYGFGNGSGTSSSDNYSVEGIAGELGFSQNGSATYGLRPGLLGSQLANLPAAPTLQNPSDWYNKLHLIIDTSDNPGDATYAVAISSDNFTTTSYVQSDNTVGASLGIEDFRDYAGWGSGAGTNIIGLTPDTTYQVKVKARQGEFSETGFGETASASTSQASIVFDIDIANSDSESAPPYNLSFGDVLPDTVTDSPMQIWLDIASNAESGTQVYVVSSNNGLASANSSHTISAITGDISSVGEGIGAQAVSVSEAGGGPLAAESPFNGSTSNVGAIDTQFRQLLTSNLPITDGRASFVLKVKTSGTTPAANDYADILTLIATAAF